MRCRPVTEDGRFTCSSCGDLFAPTVKAQARRRFTCSPCHAQMSKEYRARRKAGLTFAGVAKVGRGRRTSDVVRQARTDGTEIRLPRLYDRENARSYQAMKCRTDPVFVEKRKVRAKLHRAVRAGSLVRQPCSVCGAPKTQAHHQDYDRPLDVIWLCQKHHTEVHTKGYRKPADVERVCGGIA